MMIELGTNWVMAENVTHVTQNGQNVSIFIVGRMQALGAIANANDVDIVARINAAIGPSSPPTPLTTP